MSLPLSRRRLVQSASAAAACTVLPSVVSARRAQGSREVVFWGHNFEPAIEMYNRALEQFTQQHPDINIDYQQRPGADYPQLLLTAFAADDAPDVFRVGDWNIQSYANDGLLAPLSELYTEATGEDIRDQFVPGVLDKFTIDDVVYAIPEDLTVLLNVANMDYLQEAGFEEFPDTYDNFVAAAQATTERDGGQWLRSGQEWRYNHETWDTIQFSHLVRSYGGAIYVDGGQTLAMDSDEVLAALEFYYESFNSLGFSNASFGSDPNNNFENGDYAMMSHGPWGIPLFDTAGIVTNWQAGSWATGPEQVVVRYANTLAVNARSEVALEAAQWVGFIASRTGAELRTDIAGFLTGHRDTAEFPVVQNTPGLDSWVSSVETSEYMDQFPDYARVSAELSLMLQGVAFAGTTPQDALDATIQRLRSL